MSNVPKAKKSFFKDLTVEPDIWDSYPKVERSSLKSCTFRNLTSDTCIERSNCDNVLLEGGSKRIVIERSSLQNCTISTSQTQQRGDMPEVSPHNVTIERSYLKDCTVASAHHIARTQARRTNFVGSKHVERGMLEDSSVMGKSYVENSNVKRSLIDDSCHCERSNLDQVILIKSHVEKSNLTDCDISECQIEGTNFKGMILKYGIWNKGNLVGRIDKKEVVMVLRATAMQQSPPKSLIPPPTTIQPSRQPPPISQPPLQTPPEPAAIPSLPFSWSRNLAQDDAGTIRTEADRDSILEAEDSPEPDDLAVGSSASALKQACSQEPYTHINQTFDPNDPPPPYDDALRM